tara:strand:+ start:278 stop:700 length:423 start_codon:yes stop_codon:yes gene_type:complete
MWNKLVRLISSKKKPVERDDWFLKELQKEDPHALYQLAVMYANGQGYPKDIKRAYELIRQSANKGYAQAQLRLWSDYGYGRGLTKCFVLSYVWAQLAANNGLYSAIEVAAGAKSKLDGDQLIRAEQLLGGPIESIPVALD